MIPLILKLKKESHKNVASSQDIIIGELYGVFGKAILHGGTSIWRCYKGNRFSEDIDIYINKDVKKIEVLFNNLEKRGFSIKKKKIGNNSLFSELEINRTSVRLEALFKEARGVLKEYETADGNLITVYALTPENLIKEKVDTYLNRLKIRDLYDVFFLLRHVKARSEIKNSIKVLIKNFKQPIDEKELNVLILEGLVPKVGSMIDYIKDYDRYGERKIS